MATKTKTTTKEERIATSEITFTKEQILSSKKYANRRDALGAILSEKDSYTIKEVDTLLDKFYKGKVN